MKRCTKKIHSGLLAISLFVTSTYHLYGQENKEQESTKKEERITVTKIIQEHPYLTAFVILCAVDALTNHNRRGIEQLMREHPYLTVFVVLRLLKC